MTGAPTMAVLGAMFAIHARPAPQRHTVVGIDGENFRINDQLTYAGRTWRGHRIEGLLMNARLVQAIFDDLNPETRHLWNYPDGPWDPDRNVQEFLRMLPVWKAHGLLSVCFNLQGGSPQGYSREQPWINSAFDFETGAIRRDYKQRLAMVLDRMDELGMVPMLGLFYFGQEPRFASEQAIRNAVDETLDFVIGRGYANVIIEVANEADHNQYKHAIVRTPRVVELVRRIKERSAGKVRNPARRLYVSVSLCGGRVPADELIGECDFVLLHGNGVDDPARIGQMVDKVRASKAYRGQPIVFNEDDHFDFDKPRNNFIAAIEKRASWGYFDYRKPGEPFNEGYQSLPVDWTINSERKQGFFRLLSEMTGQSPE